MEFFVVERNDRVEVSDMCNQFIFYQFLKILQICNKQEQARL